MVEKRKNTRNLLHGFATLLLLSAAVASPSAGQAITEFSLPAVGSGPFGIAAGSDGNLWFTESLANKIGRITPGGDITEFGLATPDSQPVQICAGADGNLWFTEYSAGQIGRITPEGAVAEYAIPTPTSHPRGIVAGPDGNLWFTEMDGDRIGRVTPFGSLVEYALPAGSRGPNQITVGPDGRLWFTEFYSYKIGRATTSGVIDEIDLSSQQRNPHGIGTGPDGNAWLTEVPGSNGSLITRVLADDSLEDYSAGVYSVWEIVAGPDGNLWFTESDGKIGRVTLAGQITRFNVPTSGSGPQGIASGPDGNVWFTEFGADKIGRLTPSSSPPPSPDFSLTVSPGSQSISPGSSATATVSAAAAGGFNSSISLTASGLPSGANGAFSPVAIPAPGSGSAAMTISTSSSIAPGTYHLTLTGSGGGVTHSVPYNLTVTSSPPPGGGPCVPDDTTMCLNGGRFQVGVSWQDFQGNTGSGHVVPNTGSVNSGLMWFFGASNWELLLKVLDGCGVNGNYWVFGAASTTVAYTITVTDLQTGAQRTYTNPLGNAAAAITDTSAFPSCP